MSLAALVHTDGQLAGLAVGALPRAECHHWLGTGSHDRTTPPHMLGRDVLDGKHRNLPRLGI